MLILALSIALLPAPPQTGDMRMTVASLPLSPTKTGEPSKADWLITDAKRFAAAVYRGVDAHDIELSNGLIRRSWRLRPNGATVAFDNLMTGEAILRGVKPEGLVELDGKRYAIGGLLGQPDYAYLRRDWLETMTSDPGAFQCTGFETGRTKARFPWKRVRYSEGGPWPPPGASLALRFEPPGDALKGLMVLVHYEMYDGIPIISKWLEIQNRTGRAVRLNTFVSELLAAVEHGSQSEAAGGNPHIQIESDYSFLATRGYSFLATHPSNGKIARWVPDKQYTTQVNYFLDAPLLLETRPPIGPDVVVEAGGSFETFRIFELIHDSTERERRGLAVRRMYRTLAPWVTENPILMHVRRAEPDAVRLAIDQCAEAGFEMVIMSFGSNFNIENEDPAYLAQIRELVDYGRSKDVGLGGYSLLASRKISAQDDVINPKTGKPGGAIFENSPCLGSGWGKDYLRNLTAFIEETGISVLEHDGSYPGDVCASTSHPGHRGLEDSQWMQWKTIAAFYQWCRARGVYLNVPDEYFFAGSSKTGMGYREDNWSLPRERQIVLGRQNIFDGTWDKTPSMGWMFVPLVQYHGGGAAATLEPLRDHLDAYGQHLAQNFGAGVQACYRGPRLFDSEETKTVVKKWVSFYKKHRAILDSDVVHVRRPDGRDLDLILHVNPWLPLKGLAMIYNPLGREVARTVTLPLYYTGLRAVANICEQEGKSQPYRLNRECKVDVPVRLPARGMTWLVIE